MRRYFKTAAHTESIVVKSMQVPPGRSLILPQGYYHCDVMRSGKRALSSIMRFLENKLKLKVDTAKSGPVRECFLVIHSHGMRTERERKAIEIKNIAQLHLWHQLSII